MLISRFPRSLKILRWWMLANTPACILYLSTGLFHGNFDYDIIKQWAEDKSRPCEPTALESEVWGLMSDASETVVPSHVPKILDEIGWWKRLDLHPIDEEGRLGYKKHLHLGSWYRKFDKNDTEAFWHHWIFLTDLSPASAPWDVAFARIASRLVIEPAANGAGFHHAACKPSGLCTRLLVRAPALIHFTTETQNGETHRVQVGSKSYEKVVMRVAELGWEKRNDNDASPRQQLKSLIYDADAWQHRCRERSEQEHLSILLQMNHVAMIREHPGTYGMIVSLGRIMMPLLWPREIFQNYWLAKFAYGFGAMAMKVTRFGYDAMRMLLCLGEDEEISEGTLDEMRRNSETSALELATSMLQCVENDAHLIERTLDPNEREAFAKLREVIPESYRKALDNGEVSCDLPRP